MNRWLARALLAALLVVIIVAMSLIHVSYGDFHPTLLLFVGEIIGIAAAVFALLIGACFFITLITWLWEQATRSDRLGS